MSDGERTPLLLHSGRRQDHSGTSSSVEREYQSVMREKVKKCFSVENVKNKFPISRWLPKYNLQYLQCDVISGLTVALTVIPQGLAYAKIANLPPQYGLYSAFMGCFVYMILGTSKDITLGPTAIMSLMTAAFAQSPVENDATYAIILTLMCGIVQFVMGACHLGILVSFISYPVINAFTSAAAITIAFGQVKGILGLKNIPRDFLEMVYETCKNIPETNVWDLTMGLICLVVLFLLKKLRTFKWKDNPDDPPLSIPKIIVRKFIWLLGTAANAVVVVTASGVAAIMLSQGIKDKLSLTGDITPGLPHFGLPSFSLDKDNVTRSGVEILRDLGSGLGIVPLLGLVEAVAIGKAFARQNNYKIIPNQELLAIGAANILSSFVSAYPVTGSFSRTAVNSQSGVCSPASGLVTGAVVLLALQVLTPLFYYIPKACLSAVIIAAVLQMVDIKIIRTLWKVQKLDLIPLFVTFIASLTIGIEYGILVGIGVSLIILLQPMARPRVKMSLSLSGHLQRKSSFSETIQHCVAVSQGDYLSMEEVQTLEYIVVSFDQGVRFPAVEYIQSKITQQMEAEDKPRPVILDCTYLSGLDFTTLQGLMELVADFSRRDVAFVVACLQPKLLEEVMRAEIPGLLHSPTLDGAFRLVKEFKKEDELIVVDVKASKSANGDSTGYVEHF